MPLVIMPEEIVTGLFSSEPTIGRRKYTWYELVINPFLLSLSSLNGENLYNYNSKLIVTFT